MNHTQTLEKLRSLRLSAMADAYQNTIETRQSLTADELLSYLVEAECADRHNRKVRRNLKEARFRYQSAVEQVDYFSPRNLDKNTFLRLSDCSFVRQHDNLIITGSTGTGKSFISSAIGNQACLHNVSPRRSTSREI
jgi:DNA replication protein DnaC